MFKISSMEMKYLTYKKYLFFRLVCKICSRSTIKVLLTVFLDYKVLGSVSNITINWKIYVNQIAWHANDCFCVIRTHHWLCENIKSHGRKGHGRKGFLWFFLLSKLERIQLKRKLWYRRKIGTRIGKKYCIKIL